MTPTDFATRLFAAVLLGCLVGFERQWRQRLTGLRTNGLVAAGAAMFVMMGALISGDGNEGRVAAYVVSGIGFLGGGVILKDGIHIRGLNTAATLWCTAAVGTLAGVGQLSIAATGALCVLGIHLLLRPLERTINRAPVAPQEQEIFYRFRCTCRAPEEARVRALFLQSVARGPLVILALNSRDQEGLDRVEVVADLRTMGRRDELLEHIVENLSLEASVTAISWSIIESLSAMALESQSISGTAPVIPFSGRELRPAWSRHM